MDIMKVQAEYEALAAKRETVGKRILKLRDSGYLKDSHPADIAEYESLGIRVDEFEAMLDVRGDELKIATAVNKIDPALPWDLRQKAEREARQGVPV